MSATACDSSPYAAKVNSQVIKQTALNAELRAWAGNSAYVAAFNNSNSSTGVTVAGDAPGTYSTTWVAGILGGMIDATVFRQRLAAIGTDAELRVSTPPPARSTPSARSAGTSSRPASARPW